MLKKILEKFDIIKNLEYTLSLLHWDQSTYMPVNGIGSRSEAMETITRIMHDTITQDSFYNDLCEAINNTNLTDDEKKEAFRIKENVERARKIPTDLASEMAKTTSIGMDLWQQAKKTNEDGEYLKVLEKIFDLNKKIADYMGYEKNPYDALLDEYDRGLKFESISPLFYSLEKELSIILDKIESSNKKINDDFLFKEYDVRIQEEFGLDIIKKMGIDFKNFRQDFSAHPFTTKIGLYDIRITTDITRNNFKKGFFSTIHEAGHALYELGVTKNFNKSIFGKIDSLSLHESQSRFYENIIGRSNNFWSFFYKKLKDIFNENLKNISLENFYEAINKIKKSPIRVESDELTYNLHIILRTQLENDLINNKINVKSINDTWNEKTKNILGFYPESKSKGYLQDIHWSSGLVGYFPTYTLGNLIASQLNFFIKKDIDTEIINDDILIKINKWFDDKLYKMGSIYSSFETVKQITGTELNSKYFISYLKEKLLNIY